MSSPRPFSTSIRNSKRHKDKHFATVIRVVRAVSAQLSHFMYVSTLQKLSAAYTHIQIHMRASTLVCTYVYQFECGESKRNFNAMREFISAPRYTFGEERIGRHLVSRKQ